MVLLKKTALQTCGTKQIKRNNIKNIFSKSISTGASIYREVQKSEAKRISIRYSDQSDPDGEKINVLEDLSKEEWKILSGLITKMYKCGKKLLITYREF